MATVKHFLFGIAWLLSVSPVTQAKEFEDATLAHIQFPDWFIDSPFLDLNEDLANARASGKQGLMVVYTTEGCSYCGLFIKQSLDDPEITAIATTHFDSVGLEIFSDANLITPQGKEMSAKEFAQQEGVMFSPTILFYDPAGMRITRITGFQSKTRFKTSLQYVIGKHYRTQTMAQYVDSLNKQTIHPVPNTPLLADTLFSKPPHLLQRNRIPANAPLLVIFESRACEECEVFHKKVLHNDKVRRSLANYEIVRLDSSDNKSMLITPDGNRMTPASWYKHEGFSRTPALMFFNESGYAAIKTDNLVLKNRMLNSINYVKEQAYKKGWSYQRFARAKTIEKNLNTTPR